MLNLKFELFKFLFQRGKDTTMKLPILILGIVATLKVNAEFYSECLSCVNVNGVCHNISHVLDINAPFRKRVVIHKMAILRSKNTLFFTFEPIFEDREYYKTGFVNLDSPDQIGIISGRQIEDILNLGTFDIDQDNNLIYLGGDKGIYILDINKSAILAYSSLGDTITNIFYSNNVYFTRYNENGIIVKNGDYFRTVHENIEVKKFVVTKDYVFVYLNSTGLHVRKNDVVHTLSIYPFYRGITIDLDGNVYTWWLDGIYKIDINKNLTLTKMFRVVELLDIGTVTFDNDNNILFTADKSLYVIKKASTDCGPIVEQ